MRTPRRPEEGHARCGAPFLPQVISRSLSHLNAPTHRPGGSRTSSTRRRLAIMDTTRDNFEAVLPQIVEDLQSCEFVAMDFEMTGIGTTDSASRSSHGDLPQVSVLLRGGPLWVYVYPSHSRHHRLASTTQPQERYAKMRTVASRYNIIQLGLCTFTKGKGGKGELVARPYNIYTCADEGEDVCLSLSAITFLRGNKMDFNTWLSKVGGSVCVCACWGVVMLWRVVTTLHPTIHPPYRTHRASRT